MAIVTVQPPLALKKNSHKNQFFSSIFLLGLLQNTATKRLFMRLQVTIRGQRQLENCLKVRIEGVHRPLRCFLEHSTNYYLSFYCQQLHVHSMKSVSVFFLVYIFSPGIRVNNTAAIDTINFVLLLIVRIIVLLIQFCSCNTSFFKKSH